MGYMKVSEVANQFKVSRQSVHKWIKKGILKAEIIAGSTVRIKKEEVEKLKKEAK